MYSRSAWGKRRCFAVLDRCLGFGISSGFCERAAEPCFLAVPPTAAASVVSTDINRGQNRDIGSFVGR